MRTKIIKSIGVIVFCIVLSMLVGVFDYSVSQEMSGIASNQVDDYTQSYKILKSQSLIHTIVQIGRFVIFILGLGWVYTIFKK